MGGGGSEGGLVYLIVQLKRCPYCKQRDSCARVLLPFPVDKNVAPARGMEQQGGRLLLELPEEVLVHIFSFLQAREIYHVERVCKILYRLTNDEGLWRVFCRRSWRNTRGGDRIEENQQHTNRWKRAFFYREHAERSWKAQGKSKVSAAY